MRRLLTVAGVLALLCGLVAALVWSSIYDAARDVERRELNAYLDASSAGWAQVTDQFFAVPEAAAQSIASLSEYLPERDEKIALLAESIRSVPALDAAFVGYPDGSFVFVARSDEPEYEFRIREITVDQGVRTVTLSWTDANLNSLRSEVDPTNTYDPRERPWYQPAAAGVPATWTDPYVFASSQEQGITHSLGMYEDSGELRAVVGIDIRLTRLSEFLDQLKPGGNGEAAVLDTQGQVLARSASRDQPAAESEPSAEWRSVVLGVQQDGEELAPSTTRTSDGRSTMVARQAGAPNQWYLAVRALDADFIASASRAGTERNLGMVAAGISVAVFVGAIALMGVRNMVRLRQYANRDELTGILSRREVKRRLQKLLRRNVPLWVAIVDLDRFKAINDEHGHAMGDSVLEVVAHRLQTFARAGEGVAGRLGGDEFVIVAEHDLEWGRLADEVRLPIQVDEYSFEVGGSIGVAHSTGERLVTADELLRDADLALFDAKRAGGSRHHVAPDRREVR